MVYPQEEVHPMNREPERHQAEQERQLSEQQRTTQEEMRQTGEDMRLAAELIRTSAEQIRENAAINRRLTEVTHHQLADQSHRLEQRVADIESLLHMGNVRDPVMVSTLMNTFMVSTGSW